MKILVGGARFQVGPGAAGLAKVSEKIEQSVFNQIENQTTRAAPAIMSRIKTRLLADTTREAEKMFDVVGDVIDKPRYSISGLQFSDLMRGTSTVQGFQAIGGRVEWPGLSLQYSMKKARDRPANKYRMFRYSNAMRNYLRRSGPSIVRGRLGGIKVDVKPLAKNAERVTQSYIRDFLIGRLTVTIFPRLSPMLAPGLSTRRWTDVDKSGAMEKAIFSGTRTAQKLVNRMSPYRPLVAPTVQFFILNRIPNQIRRTLLKNLK